LPQRGGQHGLHLAGQLAEFPATHLWVVKMKVCEELVISQVPEAGAVICHGVEMAGDVVVGHHVPVVALV